MPSPLSRWFINKGWGGTSMWIRRAGVAFALVIAGGAIAYGQRGPQITTTSLPAGSVGSSYTAQIVSNLGGSNFGPPTWSVVGGNLPPGISLTVASGPTAILSGTPTAAGTFGFTVLVTQMLETGDFQSVTQALSIAVSGGIELSATAL